MGKDRKKEDGANCAATVTGVANAEPALERAGKGQDCAGPLEEMENWKNNPGPGATEEEEGDAPGEDGPAEESDREEMRRLRSRVEEVEDRLLRALADQDNYRRRVIAERASREALACESLLMELLPVVDNFDLGLRAARDRGEGQTADGLALILDQLHRIFQNRGVEELGRTGEPFDPHSAAAIASVTDGKVPADHVLRVVRPGYRLGEKLLRPALVIVSAGLPAEAGGKE
ncbi:MAG: nucleotide exchange factor GrpE [Puniceicoccales bacterium]|jgi:molecular chaperone GrpE|nr:nucleotide exchange factor GrpE [Puniceicoccales bacterium]